MRTGSIKYNHGDTIEFKLGSLVLGKVKGAAIITPMELAGDSDNKLTKPAYPVSVAGCGWQSG